MNKYLLFRKAKLSFLFAEHWIEFERNEQKNENFMLLLMTNKTHFNFTSAWSSHQTDFTDGCYVIQCKQDKKIYKISYTNLNFLLLLVCKGKYTDTWSVSWNERENKCSRWSCLHSRNQAINSPSFRVSKKDKCKVHTVPFCSFPSPVGRVHFLQYSKFSDSRTIKQVGFLRITTLSLIFIQIEPMFFLALQPIVVVFSQPGSGL